MQHSIDPEADAGFAIAGLYVEVGGFPLYRVCDLSLRAFLGAGLLCGGWVFGQQAVVVWGEPWLDGTGIGWKHFHDDGRMDRIHLAEIAMAGKIGRRPRFTADVAFLEAT